MMKCNKKPELDVTKCFDEYDGVFATIGHKDNSTGMRLVRRVKGKYCAEDWNDMTRDEQISLLVDLQGMYSLFSHFLKQKGKEG